MGAAVTWSEIEREPLRPMLPALAEAARTVGSPQIRNAGTIGGNLGTCSPAGDGLPVLAALDAAVELVGAGGARTLPVARVHGRRQAHRARARRADRRRSPCPVLDGWQGYTKVGVRNAMVIAIASACLAVDVPVAIGAARARLGRRPTIIRCPEAEALRRRRGRLDARRTVADDVARRFGELAAAAEPPDRRPPLDRRLPPPRRRRAGRAACCSGRSQRWSAE